MRRIMMTEAIGTRLFDETPLAVCRWVTCNTFVFLTAKVAMVTHATECSEMVDREIVDRKMVYNPTD